MWGGSIENIVRPTIPKVAEVKSSVNDRGGIARLHFTGAYLLTSRQGIIRPAFSMERQSWIKVPFTAVVDSTLGCNSDEIPAESPGRGNHIMLFEGRRVTDIGVREFGKGEVPSAQFIIGAAYISSLRYIESGESLFLRKIFPGILY